MKKMKTQLIQLALGPLTHLKPKSKNETRWSSMFEMVNRYYRFKEEDVLKKLCEDVPDMESYMLIASEERRLLALKKIIDELHLCTKQLQDETMTFGLMRELFDILIQDYPEMGKHIGPQAEIVHSRIFESALYKISSHQSQSLTEDEKLSVMKLKTATMVDVETQANILKRAHEAHIRKTYED